MNIKKILTRQFGHPSGSLGKLVSRLMAVSNKPLSEWTIEKINARRNDCILEIGYGTGDTFGQLAKYLDNGFIAGTDHSKLMFRQAGNKLKNLLRKNKAVLHHGTAWDIDYAKNSFDIVFASNVHFFWKEPVKEFDKIYDLLKNEGRVVIVFQSRWLKSVDELYHAATTIKQHLIEAGFSAIRIDFKEMKPVSAVCVIGRKRQQLI